MITSGILGGIAALFAIAFTEVISNRAKCFIFIGLSLYALWGK